MITPDLERWLKDAGYEHYVFISYPRVPQADAMRCAVAIATAIRQRLSDYTAVEPCRQVFLDEQCIPKGKEWETRLKRAVSRSVVFIAVCSPIYYRREHYWCGREYQAMLSLREIRQAGAIAPLLVRRFRNYPLPEAVGSLQYFDLVEEVTTYRDFTKRPLFRKTVDKILELTVEAATELRANCATADKVPGIFEFPETSAFDDYDPPIELAPMRAKL